MISQFEFGEEQPERAGRRSVGRTLRRWLGFTALDETLPPRQNILHNGTEPPLPATITVETPVAIPVLHRQVADSLARVARVGMGQWELE